MAYPGNFREESRWTFRDGLHMCATEQCKMGRVKVGRDVILYLVGL